MMSKIFFLICFQISFVLLLCRLLRREFLEVVFVMERNPSCSMKTLHELCESQLARRFLGAKGMRMGGRCLR
jgi:hypothetical protein